MFLTLEDSHNIFVSEEIRLHNSTHRMITILFKKKKDVCRVCVWLSWPSIPVCLGPEGFFQDVRIFMLTEMNRMSWSLPCVYVCLCLSVCLSTYPPIYILSRQNLELFYRIKQTSQLQTKIHKHLEISLEEWGTPCFQSFLNITEEFHLCLQKIVKWDFIPN